MLPSSQSLISNHREFIQIKGTSIAIRIKLIYVKETLIAIWTEFIQIWISMPRNKDSNSSFASLEIIFRLIPNFYDVYSIVILWDKIRRELLGGSNIYLWYMKPLRSSLIPLIVNLYNKLKNVSLSVNPFRSETILIRIL